MKFNKLLVPILFTLVFLFLVANRVTKVDCTVESSECPPELAEHSKILKGSSFFFGNFEKKLHENLLENNVYLLQSVTKKLPGTIVLTFEQEEIEYSLQFEGETKYVGKSGTIIPNNSQPQDVLLIEWKTDQELIKENRVQNKYHQLFLTITQSLTRTSQEQKKIIWNSDSEVILDIPGRPLFIFDSETIETQIKKVDTIVNAKELDEIEEPILEIDMRFDLPVLRTRQ